MHSIETSLIRSMTPSSIVQITNETDWLAARECRSSVSRETRSAVDVEDGLFGIKLQWQEILGNSTDGHNPEETLSETPGVVVMDAKGMYDKLLTTVYTFRGEEKHTDVEARALKKGTQASNHRALRVHGDTRRPNPPTEGHEPGPLLMYFDYSPHRKRVYDVEYQSARKKEAAGNPLFENTPMEVMKSSGPSKESVVGAANQDFPDYEPLSGDRRDEDKMLSLEDLYPCRFGSGASLSMLDRECEECKRGAR